MRNRWKVCMHFDNGTSCLFSVTLPEIAAFIKKSIAKNNGIKEHNTLPIDSWLVDLIFDKAGENYPTVRLTDAIISKRG